MKATAVVAVIATAAASLACQRSQAPAPQQPAAAQQPAASPQATSVAGVHWSVPGMWGAMPARAMRVATYELPAARGSEPGECAVFHFGPDQGGTVEANVARWAGQFEGSPEPVRTTRDVGGMKVTVVEIHGTFMAPGGPMMRSQGSMPGYELMGAIVPAPEGPVFFKCTGPEATMEASRTQFDALVSSIAKQ